MDITELFKELGLDSSALSSGTLQVRSPVDGASIAVLSEHTRNETIEIIGQAHEAFLA